MHIFSGKNVLLPKVDWAPAPMDWSVITLLLGVKAAESIGVGKIIVSRDNDKESQYNVDSCVCNRLSFFWILRYNAIEISATMRSMA